MRRVVRVSQEQLLIIALVLIVGIFVTAASALNNPSSNTDKLSSAESIEITEASKPTFKKSKIISLINTERKKKDLNKLQASKELDAAAKTAIKRINSGAAIENPFSVKQFTGYVNDSGFSYQQYQYNYTWSDEGSAGIVKNFKSSSKSDDLIYSSKMTHIGVAIKDAASISSKGSIPLSNSKIVIILLAQAGPAPYNPPTSYDTQAPIIDPDLDPNKYRVSPDAGGTVPDVRIKIDDEKPTAPPDSQPQYTYGQALTIAQNNCSQYSNSSAYQQCVNAYMVKFGY